MDDPLFEELHALSLDIANGISSEKNTSGASNYAIMVPGVSCPIIYLSEKNNLNRTSGTYKKNDLTNDVFLVADKTLYKDTLSHFL